MVAFKSTFVTLSLAAIALAQSSGSTIGTPGSLIQCQPIQLTWTAGNGGPYFVSAIPGGDPSGAPIEQISGGSFPEGTLSYAWTVNIPSGTSITLKIIDKSGVPNYSDKVTILPGADTCALVSVSGAAAAPASSSSGASSSKATTAAGSAASAAATTSGMATATRSGSSSTTTAASAAATTSRASSANNVVVGTSFFAVAAAAMVAAL